MIEIQIGMTMEHVERVLILETLKHYNGNRSKTAKTLGISIRCLYNKINSYTCSECRHNPRIQDSHTCAITGYFCPRRLMNEHP